VLTDYTAKLKTFISKPFSPIQKDVLTERLVQVLRLYDHILIEEYSPRGDLTEVRKSRSEEREKESFEQSGLADHFQMCDFCGADIFQSYFRCSKSSGPESGTIICSGCYAEGRTCACENMEPKQRQKFSVLLSARWEALEALKNTGYSIETFEGSETQKEQKSLVTNICLKFVPLLNLSYSFFAKVYERSVFQAAVLVHRMRLKNKTVYLTKASPVKSLRLLHSGYPERVDPMQTRIQYPQIGLFRARNVILPSASPTSLACTICTASLHCFLSSKTEVMWRIIRSTRLNFQTTESKKNSS
jgi:hypothetical protein